MSEIKKVKRVLNVALAHEEASEWNEIIKAQVEAAGRCGLTGLMRRKQFEIAMRREIRRRGRDNQPLTLGFFDIDKFKKYNDKYGHNKGDSVLETLGKLMIEKARKVDILARWGGDEFVILYLNTDIDGAKTAAEDFIKLVENELGKRVGLEETITISMGLTEYFEGLKIDDWVEEADKGMYLVKEAGGNGVGVFREEDL
ncbi:MAG: GGDEF domain-containing protein [Patescibacteria group bacterium]|nr:GGDEF domain-containing protein [Patescibacteria group bacterium]